MKRFLFLLILCALGSPAWAVATFTPTVADLLSFTDLPGFSVGDYTDFGVFTSPGAAYGSASLQGDVGYHADNVGGVGTLEYVGVGKGAFDLTGFDTFDLVICNDNNQDWVYRLFASDGATTVYSGAWVAINSDNSLPFSVDLTGLATLDSVTIGFQVGRSNQSDEFHTSVSPVPAPEAVLLASVGIGLVGWLRRRNAL
ncbi:MAG: hypothetical protein JW955_09155 [Sedimentisphaerales bacterium]|nr:hypothetical protein [Sedimentisphaerales bacterium]